MAALKSYQDLKTTLHRELLNKIGHQNGDAVPRQRFGRGGANPRARAGDEGDAQRRSSPTIRSASANRAGSTSAPEAAALSST